MKKSKFSEGQIAFVFKQAEDDVTVGKVCRKAKMAECGFSYRRTMRDMMKR
jgi:hypothetical protein